MPKFEPLEIQTLFAALHYPGTIRSDAITAVGAPSSIQFLMRAIYWLYSVTKVYFFEKKEVCDVDEEAKRGIPEVNEDDQGEDSPMAGLTRLVEEPLD